MANLTTRWIRSLDELRVLQGQWDELWLRSATTLATARAELLAQWIEQFSPGGRCALACVEQGSRLVAALPLVRRRIGGVVTVAGLPGNAWSTAGDLLLDPFEAQAALPLLAQAVIREAPVLWLGGIVDASSRWHMFRSALAELGAQCHLRKRFDVGTVEIHGSWEEYQAAWSRNHRRSVRRNLVRAGAEGQLRLALHDGVSPDNVHDLLRQAFSIEDNGWKGAASSSVLRAPGMFEFYVRQAQQLAASKELVIVFLELAGKVIAFEYGWRAKGVYHSLKVGYDEAYHRIAPGQLLRGMLLEHFFAESGCHKVDYTGPLCDATAKWSNAQYTVSRLAVFSPSVAGRLAAAAYIRWLPRVKEILGVRRPVSEPQSAHADSSDEANDAADLPAAGDESFERDTFCTSAHSR